MNKWKIATFVFAFFFIVMLAVSIYQRQFILDEEEHLQIYNETVLTDENTSVKKGYMVSQQFVLFDYSYLDLTFISDNPANIYLLEANEYLRYENAENFYYLERNLESKNFYLKDKLIEAGTYYIVIEALEQDVNYHLKLVAKPYY